MEIAGTYLENHLDYMVAKVMEKNLGKVGERAYFKLCRKI
jgi:hypothetical protein